MRKSRLAAAALALCAGIVAGPVAVAAAAPASVVHTSFTEGPFTSVYEPCGAVETVTIHVRDTDFYDGSGEFVRGIVHFFYDSVVTGPSGRSISLDAHQTLEFQDGVATLTGQGPNVRAPGLGLLYQDVGRQVTDVTGPPPGVSLFSSAKSVSFAAADPDELAAAICTAVG